MAAPRASPAACSSPSSRWRPSRRGSSGAGWRAGGAAPAGAARCATSPPWPAWAPSSTGARAGSAFRRSSPRWCRSPSARWASTASSTSSPASSPAPAALARRSAWDPRSCSAAPPWRPCRSAVSPTSPASRRSGRSPPWPLRSACSWRAACPTPPDRAAGMLPGMRPAVRVGEELELRIDTLATGGRGVGRHEGLVVFVGGALPGDRVRARITKVKRRHAEGVAVERLELGPDRVDAPCPPFGPCGGCRWQDLAYERQLEHKASQVDDALRRIGHLEGYTLEPIVGASAQYHYRNKLEYAWTAGADGPALGFHQAGRWDA